MVEPLGVEVRVRYLTCVINMAVAWVGILPRQGVLGRSTFFVVFFLFVNIFDVLIVVITIICQIIHK